MYLPLNFIPVVGTVIFVVLQGKKYGPNAHARYFQLKGMGKVQKERHVEERRGAYTAYVILPSSCVKVLVLTIFADSESALCYSR